MAEDLGAAAAAAPARHHATARRRGEPGREYSDTTFHGDRITVVADDLGVIQPETAEQVLLCDRLGLAVIHDSDGDQPVQAPVAAPAAASGKPDKRTAAALRERALDLGIEIPEGARRPELLALIQAAEADADEDAGDPTTDPTTDDADGDAGEED